jgi:hypothetical protein
LAKSQSFCCAKPRPAIFGLLPLPGLTKPAHPLYHIPVKKRRRWVILGASGVIFFLLYVILGAKPIAPSLRLHPAWIIGINAEPAPLPPETEGIPFKLGKNMGYFTVEGRILSRRTFPFAASISAQYQAAFSPDASRTAIYANTGAQTGVIKEAGFPFFEDDRIFLFRPGGTAFSRLSETGEVLWTYESYSPVTAFESSAGGIAAGYADGIIRVFSPEGLVHEVIPGGSGYPVILGVDISPDGKLIASLSGIAGQRFTLTQIDGGVNKVIAHRYLEKETNEQALVRFNASGDCVYYNPWGALCVYDSKRGVTTEFPVDGAILDIQEMPGESLVFWLSKKVSDGTARYTVWILEDSSHLVGSFSFEAEAAFIRTSPGALYVGKDTTISKITVSRE